MTSSSPRALAARLLARQGTVAAAVAALAALFLVAADATTGADRALRDLRGDLRSHDASGEIVILEIDARSIAAIDRWPWPRTVHADAVDRLRAAGVRTIAFDVDFSSASTPAADAALAAALARAGGGVILPAIRQSAGSGSREFIDRTPIPALRDHAFLGAVTVVPDADGRIRQMPLGVEIAGVARPSLALMLIEQNGTSGSFFPVDYSIRPSSIPRHSFIDLLEGRVPAAALAGKRILVGATAVELGDRYPTPGHGVKPGVVIQALAAETLLQGPVPRQGGPLAPLLLAFAAIALACRTGRNALRGIALGAGSVLVFSVSLWAEARLALTFDIAPALAALACAGATLLALQIGARMRAGRTTDSATGLPNRAGLESAAGEMEAPLVVVARISRSTEIAARIGPARTADLVHRVAERLRMAGAPAIFRIDESSLAWTEGRTGADTLEDRLGALVTLMRTPIDCGRAVDVKLSFGVAEAGEAGPEQQVARAMLAAVEAAGAGDHWSWVRAQGASDGDWRLSLVGELDAAIAHGHVWNAYQPKLDLTSGRITGAEALVRWDHPQRGLILPGAFIPLAEEEGRIQDLTLHVLDDAIADVAAWRAAGVDIGVAVNISAKLLREEAFIAAIEERIRGASVSPSRITLEITESAALREPERAIAALQRWSELGASISIDDYGTGQSTLGYLQSLPASELKIDMSFVQAMEADPRNAILVESTIAMGHRLGLKVVAEGVEHESQLERLRAMGCDTAQGWHIGKPMPADALLARLLDGEEKTTTLAA